MDFVLAYITAKDKGQALSIGKALVEERLAACVNVVDGMTSVYWWDGKVNTDDEAVLIAKTTAEKFQLLIDRVKQLHSYTCPCIVSLPITGGSEGYLEWLAEQVG
ncbi:MAG: divalent-cation tolerance protein CutA [Chitinispirillales bacterium]|jgi:periplasmic divalent cation tolerance protein|nr:divalent-cation tolerance protein CutA [Chitinispirillales bacterium]